MSRILLVNTPKAAWFINNVELAQVPPLGLLSVATYMEERGHVVHMLDLECPPLTEQGYRERLKEISPQIVGFTVVPTSWMNTRTVISVTREELDGVHIVAGGNFPTFAAETLMAEEPELDYVVCGEGEVTFAELVACLEGTVACVPQDIQGLCCREAEHGRIVRTPARDLIPDLDSLPMLNRGMMNMSAYSEPFGIITSRGCPGRCTFCSNAGMYKKVRMRSLESVLGEIGHLSSTYHMDRFFIMDDTFTTDPTRVMEFCRRLKGETGRSFAWRCESRADTMSPELAGALKDAGCSWVNIGLESADNAILRQIRKGVTVEQIEYAVRCAHEHGLIVQLSFIFGHAGDTPQTMEHLIDYVVGLQGRYRLQVAALVNTPFPGTYQGDHLADLGLSWKGTTWDDYAATRPNVSAPGFTLDQLRDIYAKAIEIFTGGLGKDRT